jgi:hypothetical protein
VFVHNLLGNVQGLQGIEGDAVRIVATEEHNLISEQKYKNV